MIARIALFIFGIILLTAACAPMHRAAVDHKNLKKEIETSPVFSRGFTGFCLMDAETGRVLCDVNADRYFTPASTTKILTLATCLAVLGDSMPALRYFPVMEDSDPGFPIGLCFRGTGDPTFLHPDFQYWQPTARMLRNGGLLIYDQSNFQEERFGPGWAWDDYNDHYSAERSGLPIHGNFVRLERDSNVCDPDWIVEPAYFRQFLKSKDDYNLNDREIRRQEQSDTIVLPYYHIDLLKPGYVIDVPVWNAQAKTPALLQDRLGLPEMPLTEPVCGDLDYQTLYGTPLDTVLRRMMYQSDNFMADQLLLVCSGVKFDTLRQAPVIRWAKDSLFGALPNPPRWVDGSGLSRYNLVTPRYLSGVLRQLWLEQPHDRLLPLFPTPGMPRTTLDWWPAEPGAQPWLFAKTGSMSGVQCMSGYIVTKRGKVLIFSFMNNNFTGSGRPWKEEMRRVLQRIRDSG
ncbi:MAG: D-alanyl-D-alanine carboxypeptidase [Saprospiraceae bacterium]|nr:D-alanyl-D-alanine carboxypeptidase [Saprospiraceae bacterium]